MPRAQYVGYTATPFANVFVDPDDPEDIFPKDFIVGLPRPAGLHGRRRLPRPGPTRRRPEHTSPTRTRRPTSASCAATDEDGARHDASSAGDGRLRPRRRGQALPACGPRQGRSFRHHTMLVHESVSARPTTRTLADAHRRPVDRRRLRHRQRHGAAAAASTATTCLPVSAARPETGVPVPPDFDELEPYIGKAHRAASPSTATTRSSSSTATRRTPTQQDLDFDRTASGRSSSAAPSSAVDSRSRG